MIRIFIFYLIQDYRVPKMSCFKKTPPHHSDTKFEQINYKNIAINVVISLKFFYMLQNETKAAFICSALNGP